MIDKKYTYAIVGASNNEEKYGYKVLRDLKDAGYKVVPINPREKEILGLRAYLKLSDYKEGIDVVVFVVPPQVTEAVLKEVRELEIKNVWMQPGSESWEAIEYCEKNNINYIHNACIMIDRKQV
ncbi:CoA-binding protein [Candidatus Parcubacteria bacterium]|nr:MAG: CoA-binding protein [Candidatus Parcubacteria bacterium]